MGLCKCSKRRVTNLFCYVHRVNVCEDCMITQHSRCVVQSYLKWLEDSDFDPVCVLCSKSIQEGEVIRLACYDLFHLPCLDKYAKSLPHTTAPAGYTCPKCKEALFPPVNMVSPVADRLRHVLRSFSWARDASRGLQTVQLVDDASSGSELLEDIDSLDVDFGSPVTSTPKVNHSHSTTADLSTSQHPHSSHIALQLYDQPVSRGGGGASVSRMVASSDMGSGVHSDSDENKYRRKNPLEMFSRWFRQHKLNLTMDESTVVMRRYLVLVFLAVFAVVTVIVLLTRVGRNATDGDPNLDWRNNPNIKTGD